MPNLNVSRLPQPGLCDDILVTVTVVHEIGHGGFTRLAPTLTSALILFSSFFCPLINFRVFYRATRNDNSTRAYEHYASRDCWPNGPGQEQAAPIFRPIRASNVNPAISECVLNFLFLGLIQKNRKEQPPKGDINSPWEHDMFLGGGSQKASLVERLSEQQKPPKVNMGAAVRALEKATGTKDISIRGASVRGNLIEVKGLVAGTTADDVEVSVSDSLLVYLRQNLDGGWCHRQFSSVVDLL